MLEKFLVDLRGATTVVSPRDLFAAGGFHSASLVLLRSRSILASVWIVTDRSTRSKTTEQGRRSNLRRNSSPTFTKCYNGTRDSLICDLRLAAPLQECSRKWRRPSQSRHATHLNWCPDRPTGTTFPLCRPLRIFLSDDRSCALNLNCLRCARKSAAAELGEGGRIREHPQESPVRHRLDAG